MNRLLPIMLLCFILCGCHTSSPAPAQENEVVVNFFFPTPGKYPDMQEVYSEANAMLGLPGIRIEFHPIWKNEYFEKLSIYLASKKQVDLACGNDKNFISLQKIRENSFTILNPLLDQYGDAIKQSIPEEIFAQIAFNDRIYYIPTLTYCEGYFPFLKIPKSLSRYLDVQALSDMVQSSDNFHQSLFSVLSDYLEKLSDEKLLQNGVDLYSLYETIPLCGYEAIPSTNGLFAYKLGNPRQVVALQNTAGFREMLDVFNRWESLGYVRKDKMLMYKSKPKNNGYVLSAFWGGISENGICSITGEEVNDDFDFFPLDGVSHRARLLTDHYIFISRDTAYAAEAMQVLNRFYQSDDLYTLLTYGTENTHFTRESDGTVEYASQSYAMYPNIFPVAEDPLCRIAFSDFHWSAPPLSDRSLYRILPHKANSTLSNYINEASKKNEMLMPITIESETEEELIRIFSEVINNQSDGG